eukprot:jgi/Mesen1/7890/ME000420S07038
MVGRVGCAVATCPLVPGLKASSRVASEENLLVLQYWRTRTDAGAGGEQRQEEEEEAVGWLRRAADADVAKAQYSLALCFQRGRGTAQDATQAAYWYSKAAAGGSSRAMYNLALCFRTGEGLRAHEREAKRWMRRAAEAGHANAQHEHALLLLREGNGGQSLFFLELASRTGHAAAKTLRDDLAQRLSPRTLTKAISMATAWEHRHKLRTRH